MSTTDAALPAIQSTEKPSLGRYHLIVLVFFLTALAAQSAYYYKHIDYIPEELRGLTNVLVLVISIVNSGFTVCVIPLAVVFIFGWLYLMDIEVKVWRLYQITVMSIIPLILLMLGSLGYTLLVMDIDAATSQQLRELSATLLEQMKVDPGNASAAQEWTALLQSQREGYFTAMSYLNPMAAGLCCLICGYLLHRRLNLAIWKALLIPTTFAASVVLFRTLASTGAGQLSDQIERILNP